MKIKIENKRKISTVQNEFCKSFPYLRIEFFFDGKGSKKETMLLPHYKTIGDCRSVHNSGTVYIIPEMKVRDLEQIFKKDFGLNVQVFRKSGRVWLETKMTDDWTLVEQNQQGEELSKFREQREKTFSADKDQE